MVKAGKNKMLAKLITFTACALLAFAVPVTAEEKQDAPEADLGISADSKTIDNADTLREYLKKDGDYKLILTDDLSDRVAKKGQFKLGSGENVDFYWITLGSGVKIIELDGHDIFVSNDLNAVSGEFCLFRIPQGATFILNDKEDSGEINYNGSLSDSNSPFLAQRDLIEVDGGTLRVNGGYLNAGRSSKFYDAGKADHYYKQINGTAVEVRSGTAVFNGGHMSGRGFLMHKKAGDSENVRDAALIVSNDKNTKVVINDGEFLGEGCADSVQVEDNSEDNTNWTNIKVYGGFFNTYKQDEDIVATKSISSAFGTSYGHIGLEGGSIARDAVVSEYKRGTITDIMTTSFVDTSSRLTVTPPKEMQVEFYDFTTGKSRSKFGNRVIEWDKHTDYSIGLKSAENNFDYYGEWVMNQLYGEEEVKAFYRTVTYQIKGFEGGKEKVLVTYRSGDGKIDLLKLPQADLEKLKYGQTYYLSVEGAVCWKNAREYTTKYNCPYELILKMKDPAIDLTENGGFKWEESEEGYVLVPKPSYSVSNMNKLLDSQKIDEYTVTLEYTGRENNSRKTRIFSNHEDEGVEGVLPEKIELKDLQHGKTKVTCSVSLKKDGYDVTGKGASATGTIINVPKITATDSMGDKLDEDKGDGKIIITPGSRFKTIRLSAETTRGSEFEWRRYGYDINQSKSTWIPLSGDQNYTINVTDTGLSCEFKVDQSYYGCEEYRLFYKPFPNTYYFSNLYVIGYSNGTITEELAVKNGDEVVNDYEVTANNKGSAIQVTASLDGSGISTSAYNGFYISLLEYPDGMEPVRDELGVKRTSENTYKVNLKTFFGNSIKDSYDLIPGDYVIGGYAISDTEAEYPQKISFSPFTLHITHQLQKLKIAVSDNDVTDRYVFNAKEGEELYLKDGFLPRYASAKGEAGWSSADPSVAEVDTNGVVTCKKTGTTQIIRTIGDISARTTLTVPLTQAETSFAMPSLGEEIPKANLPLEVPEGADYTAALTWDGYNEGGTFRGHVKYTPVVTITPKAGVAFPVDEEFYKEAEEYDYTYKYCGDDNGFTVIVNGKAYKGFWNDNLGGMKHGAEMPICDGKTGYTVILPEIPELIDPVDDYLDELDVSMNVPENGDKKQEFEEDDIWKSNNELNLQLNPGVLCHEVLVNLVGGDAENKDIHDDEVKGFTEYEDGKTYRVRFEALQAYGSYRNERGGCVYFGENLHASAGRLNTVVQTDPYNEANRFVYVYFTVGKDVAVQESDEESYGDVLYLMSFDANGGSGQMEVVRVKKGEVFTVPANAFTAPEGKEFSAWLIDGVSYQAGDTLTPEDDITVTAVWKEKTSGGGNDKPGTGGTDQPGTGGGTITTPGKTVQVTPPAGTVLSSVKNKKRGTVTVKWKKTDNASGYEVQYSLNKKFKKGVKTKTTNKLSLTIRKMKKGKTCYVKVRAYKLDASGKKVYGAWSKIKKVKIKK